VLFRAADGLAHFIAFVVARFEHGMICWPRPVEASKSFRELSLGIRLADSEIFWLLHSGAVTTCRDRAAMKDFNGAFTHYKAASHVLSRHTYTL